MDLISGIGTYLVPFLIILSVVVFVHELGHYLVARWAGVRVDVFSIGFGPELFGFNDRSGTRWKFSALPLGGYVKMHGDADATSSTVDLTARPDPDSFPSKTVWQRMAIVAAGPERQSGVRDRRARSAVRDRRPTVHAGGDRRGAGRAAPRAEAGLLPGDRIVAVDQEPLDSFEQLQGIVRRQPDVPLHVHDRARRREHGPDRHAARDRDRGSLRPDPQDRADRDQPLGRRVQAIEPLARAGRGRRRDLPADHRHAQALGQIVVGSRTTEELGGPLRIAQMSGEIAKDGVVPVIWFTAVLSINLGLINLFPIPLLDGGHLVMYAIEALRGRPLTERSQEVAFRFGLIVVLSLMVFATWNDLVQLNVIEFFKGLVS